MLKLRKKIAVVGMVVALSVSAVLPAIAAGQRCSVCGSTRTNPLDNGMTTDMVEERCIHGTGGKDSVGYLVEYRRYFCNSCGVAREGGTISRTEMSRDCLNPQQEAEVLDTKVNVSGFSAIPQTLRIYIETTYESILLMVYSWDVS